MVATNNTARKFLLRSRDDRSRGRRNRRQPESSSPASAGIRLRGDLDCDFHGEMVRRGSDPCPLHGNRLARLVRDRDAHEVPIPHHAARRIEVDPARAGNVDLDPCMCVTAGDKIVAVIGKVQISGHKPRSDSWLCAPHVIARVTRRGKTDDEILRIGEYRSNREPACACRHTPVPPVREIDVFCSGTRVRPSMEPRRPFAAPGHSYADPSWPPPPRSRTDGR
jgi:hypothetical protein